MAGHKESYKGREIVAEGGDGGHEGHSKLTIDGKEIEVHVHEDGSVETHDYMFQLFGSPTELARALIDQMPAV